jgi:enoyl-CoA hydratase/carnithine racemase
VLFGHGKHFTAGLDLPKWTTDEGRGRGARARPQRPRRPMALARACRKPIVTAVHGITYTAGSR